jgi:DNA-binding transcriptional regulator YiaG
MKTLRVSAGDLASYSLYDKYITYVKIRQEKISEPKVDRKGIARRIREIRGFDLNQGQFARRLGLSQAQLSKYEHGQNLPTVEILLKLQAFSGRSIDWILTGTESN